MMQAAITKRTDAIPIAPRKQEMTSSASPPRIDRFCPLDSDFSRRLNADVEAMTGEGQFAEFFSGDTDRMFGSYDAFMLGKICNTNLIRRIDQAVQERRYRQPAVAAALRLYITRVIGSGTAETLPGIAKSPALRRNSHPDKTIQKVLRDGNFSNRKTPKLGLEMTPRLCEIVAYMAKQHYDKARELVENDDVLQTIFSPDMQRATSSAEAGAPGKAQGIFESLRRLLRRRTMVLSDRSLIRCSNAVVAMVAASNVVLAITTGICQPHVLLLGLICALLLFLKRSDGAPPQKKP